MKDNRDNSHGFISIQRLKTASDGLMFGAAFLLVVVLGPVLGEYAEGYYLPVFTNASVEVSGRTKSGELLITLYGDKVREKCRVISIISMIQSDGAWYRTKLFNENFEPIVPVTRPKGFQVFGPWLVAPSGDRLRIVTRHDCHPLWETVTVLGEWPTPRPITAELMEQKNAKPN